MIEHLGIVATLAAAVIAQEPPPPADGETPVVVEGDLGRELDALLTDLVRWGFHGSVLVARDDAVVLQKGYGYADRWQEIANTPDTLFEIASVTKHLTAAAVLLLEQDGALSTDDSITRWLPGVPEEHAGVTIYHLLTHTSGFPRMGPTGGGADAAVAVRDYLAGGRVREPGTQFEYWNGGYALLAMIIERASARSYQEFCRERMFGPAGMTSTGFCRDPFDERRLAHGHVDDRDIGPASSRSYGWEYRGMGGIVTSVVDLHRWDRAMRAGDLLRDPAAKLERPHLSGYACGTWVETTSRGTRQLTIGGNVTGFNSTVWRLPDDDAVVIVLCNTPHHSFSVGMHLVMRLFDMGRFVSPPPKTVELGEPAIARISGTYRGDHGAVIIQPDGLGGFRVAIEGQPLVQLFMQGSPVVPPSLQARIDRAERVLRGAAEGDVEPLRQAMDPSIPADWPERFREYWGARVAGLGELTSFELLGARPMVSGPTSLRLLYRLRFEHRDALALIVLDGDRLLTCTLDVQGPALEYDYVPTSPSALATYAIGPGRNPVIEIDGSGDAILRVPSGAALTLRRE